MYGTLACSWSTFARAVPHDLSCTLKPSDRTLEFRNRYVKIRRRPRERYLSSIVDDVAVHPLVWLQNLSRGDRDRAARFWRRPKSCPAVHARGELPWGERSAAGASRKHRTSLQGWITNSWIGQHCASRLGRREEPLEAVSSFSEDLAQGRGLLRHIGCLAGITPPVPSDQAKTEAAPRASWQEMSQIRQEVTLQAICLRISQS